MANNEVKELNETNFDESIKEGISVVDFWAEWCGPCKMQGPILDTFAASAAEEIMVGKVDVDSNQKLAARFDVMSIPSILLFKNGELVKKYVGVQSVEALQEAIKI